MCNDNAIVIVEGFMTYVLLFCHRDLGANRLGEIHTGTFIHLTHLKVLYES